MFLKGDINIMKNQLRQNMLSMRKSMNFCDVQQKSQKIFEHLKKQKEFLNSKNIMIYLSCNNEVDTTHIINFCLENNKCVCVPKITAQGVMMAVKINNLDFNNEFIKNKYGIYEPKSNCEIKPGDIDLIIVPMVASDTKLNRIGYGGGYYDRFLLKTNAYKIGLCYDFQLIKDALLPTEDTDIKMDMVIYK